MVSNEPLRVSSPLTDAYNVIFGAQESDFDALLSRIEAETPTLLQSAAEGNADDALILALVATAYDDQWESAPTKAAKALKLAKEQGKPLGSFFYGQGFCFDQAEMFDEAHDSYEKALSEGFHYSYYPLGMLAIWKRANLSQGISLLKAGAEKHNDFWCKEELKHREVEPGVFAAAIPQPDGTTEVIWHSDKPGGLGKMPGAS